MASLYKVKNSWTIQFTQPSGIRPKIHLGRCRKAVAETIQSRVEEMIHCQRCGATVSPAVSDWLGKIDEGLYDQLVRVGLVEKRMTAQLEDFLNAYIDSRNDVTIGTIKRWQLDVKKLTTFFGKERKVETITPSEADQFKQYLWGTGLARTTISKHLANTKMFFDKMQRAGLLRGSNPFEGVSERAVVDQSRNVYVPRDVVYAAMEAAPDDEWRLIIALSRFGGLRCPSEVLSLQWDGICWNNKADGIVVISPKTKRYPNGARRIMPMFSELVEPLQIAWKNRPEGAKFVISKHRSQADNPEVMERRGWSACNMREPFSDILKKAEITPWQKLFHAMRASWETDLYEAGYPAHEIAKWAGHSVAMAVEHYLREREHHRERAVQIGSDYTQVTNEKVLNIDSQKIAISSKQMTQIMKILEMA